MGFLETVINIGGALFLLFESAQSIQVLNFVHEQFISTFIDLAMMRLTAFLMCYCSDNKVFLELESRSEECSKRESFVFEIDPVNIVPRMSSKISINTADDSGRSTCGRRTPECKLRIYP